MSRILLSTVLSLCLTGGFLATGTASAQWTGSPSNSNPASKVSTTSPVVEIGNGETGATEIRSSTGNHSFRISDQSNGAMIFRYNNFIRFMKIGGTTEEEYIRISGTGDVGIGTTSPASKLHVDGTITADVLEITGGSDLSESFDVAGEIVAEPGMLVSIDPTNPGALQVTAEAYDRKVVGVVSGAGGVQPGMIMGQKNTLADGALPIALTGRAYVRTIAGDSPVLPGDLLTTSASPGVAMKVDDYSRAPGATIGKALTALDAGQEGLVLVLVSLQ